MINTKIGTVKGLVRQDESTTFFLADIGGVEQNCINYNYITGSIKEGDHVVLNTTAVDLALGTGGYHFVVSNLSNSSTRIDDGHIMKLRYTPFQFSIASAEEQYSEFHDIFNEFESLGGMPVISGTLHSMLAPIALCAKGFYEDLKIVYIMTDGGALPLWFSSTVKELLDKKYIYKTITAGNSFGGDLECVNIFSALIAAKEIYQADLTIVCMGPGIVGTDTVYGFSGIEQGYIIDAVNTLGGTSVAVPRISFADPRERHYGISHHSMTILGNICKTPANIALPILEKEKASFVRRQLMEKEIDNKHNVVYVDYEKYEPLLKANAEMLNKMGRNYTNDFEYFITCGVSAYFVGNAI